LRAHRPVRKIVTKPILTRPDQSARISMGIAADGNFLPVSSSAPAYKRALAGGSNQPRRPNVACVMPWRASSSARERSCSIYGTHSRAPMIDNHKKVVAQRSARAHFRDNCSIARACFRPRIEGFGKRNACNSGRTHAPLPPIRRTDLLTAVGLLVLRAPRRPSAPAYRCSAPSAFNSALLPSLTEEMREKAYGANFAVLSGTHQSSARLTACDAAIARSARGAGCSAAVLTLPRCRAC